MEEEKVNTEGTKSIETKSPDEGIKAFEERLKQMELRLNQQQANLTKKDVENKRLQAALDDRSEENAMTKAAIAALAQRTGQSEEFAEETVKRNQPDLLKYIDEVTEKTRQKRQQEDTARKLRELQAEVSSLGYTDKDAEYWEVFGRAASGNLDIATKRIDELRLKKFPQVTQKPEKTVEETKNEVEEAARAYLEKQGLLKTETTIGGAGSGGGKTYTKDEIASMSATDYRKTFPGGLSDVMQAFQEGRIKE